MPTSNTTLTACPVDLATAFSDTLGWWDQYDALVDLDLGAVLEDVRAVASGSATVGDLHANATTIIQRVSGARSLNQFTSAEAANALHASRNVLAAFMLASHVLYGSDAHATYKLLQTLPTLAPRHGGKARPAHDDEILLTRTAAMHSLRRGGGYPRTAVQYAVAESGAHPVETTAVRPTDFDSLTVPTTVYLDGPSRWYRARTVPLTAFARHVVREGINAHLAADRHGHQSRMCFTGTTAGSASASSTNCLKHLAERVGITAPSLEGSYAMRWRAHKEMRDNGVGAALQLLGKGRPESDRQRLSDFLNLPAEATAVELEDDYYEIDDLRAF
ncbi:hypothetical protein P5P86_19620 [Nocardioides sp. BP30]|uniref:hypothetical protein n=1 Tax=Nocardioides sp. BP30 TaxID=3036374 RepID=UPI0024693194|nr:hypothetical protein [Nocardioides sp. BP30]WGL52148.1 hypothetical protein P5P86_19620 [Nocardioides sp. BP30]